MELTRQQNENWIVDALEGGSNYWYIIGINGLNAVRSVVSREEDEYFCTALHKAIFDRGAKVEIRDREDTDTVLGYLSKESIAKGLKKCKEEHPKYISQMLTEEEDAITADVIFQYCLMGEIMFG